MYVNKLLWSVPKIEVVRGEYSKISENYHEQNNDVTSDGNENEKKHNVDNRNLQRDSGYDDNENIENQNKNRNQNANNKGDNDGNEYGDGNGREKESQKEKDREKESEKEREKEESESIGIMLGLEDGDGAYYCQVPYLR